MAKENQFVQGLRNYFLAEDITQGFKRLEFTARESITREDFEPDLEDLLEITETHRKLAKISCSRFPNLLGGLGAISSWYLESPVLAVVTCYTSELLRNFGRHLSSNVQENLKDALEYLAYQNNSFEAIIPELRKPGQVKKKDF